MGLKQQDNGQDGNMFSQPRKKVGWLDTLTKVANPILGAMGSFIPGVGGILSKVGSDVLNGINTNINGTDDVPNKEVGEKIKDEAQQQQQQAKQQQQQQEDKMASMRANAAAANM